MLHESNGFIPLSHRKGHPASLFQIWFSSNMQLTTIVTGALAAAMHISLYSSMIAIFIGNLVGATIMGLHAAQGPRMMTPQMIYSREQFGTRGAALPIIVFILMYIGFYASTSVIGGQILMHLLHIPYDWAVAVLNAITVALVYLGYEVISMFQRVASYLYFAAFAYLSISLLVSIHRTGFPAGHPSVGAVLAFLPIVATWQLSYTPYVSDYSRYLVPTTKTSTITWFAGSGTFFSTVWMMMLGAVGASGFSAAQISDGSFLIVKASGEMRLFFQILFLLGIISVNVFNLYGGFMAVRAVVPSKQSTLPTLRISILGGLFGICTLVSLFGNNHFLNNYSTFLNWLLFFLIPWSAINLVDFYLLKNQAHEQVESNDLFIIQSVLPGIRSDTYAVFGISVCIEFIIQSLQHTSLILMNISRLTWLIGFICGGSLYYLVQRRPILRTHSCNTQDQTVDKVSDPK